MKRGISVEWEPNDVLVIRKARGKLALEEIEDVLRYGCHGISGSLNGNYALIFHCSEETCGGNGMYGPDYEEREGDSVRLHQLDNYGTCPVCNEMLPPHNYCPHCGKEWKNPD